MKTKAFSIVSFLTILSITVIFSCKKKKEEPPPATATIQDYVGTWNVAGGCAAPYAMTVSVSGSTLTFSNLYKCFTVTGSVSGNNFTIPTQTLSTAATTGTCGYPWTVDGSGTISGTNFNTLQLTYTIKDISGTPTNCSNTCTK